MAERDMGRINAEAYRQFEKDRAEQGLLEKVSEGALTPWERHRRRAAEEADRKKKLQAYLEKVAHPESCAVPARRGASPRLTRERTKRRHARRNYIDGKQLAGRRQMQRVIMPGPTTPTPTTTTTPTAITTTGPHGSTTTPPLANGLRTRPRRLLCPQTGRPLLCQWT
eukprot:scaffold115_cov304-Prasinococcus_capsulatus_cf.AAC.6